MKRLFGKIGLIVLVLVSFRVLDGLPIPYIHETVAAIVGLQLAIVAYYYVVRRLLLKDFSYSSFEVYALTIMALPLVTAFMANEVFGQPLLYGVLAQRSIWAVSSALVFLVSIRHGFFTQEEIQDVIVGTAWILLVVYTIVVATVDPKLYEDLPSFIARGGGAADVYRFKFQSIPIVIGFLFYFCKAFRTLDKRYYLYSAPFILFLIFANQGRSLMFALLVAISYFVYRWSSVRKYVVLVVVFFAVAPVAYGLAYLSSGDAVNRLTGRFADAFTVVLKGTLTADMSANARILETTVALPYVKRYWVLGTGGLSQQWEDGYKNKLGFFHPTDIGLIGVVFIYGLAGALLLFGQFLYAVRYAKAQREDTYSPFTDASKALLLYLAIHSLITGFTAFYPAASLLFIAILRASSRYVETREVYDGRFIHENNVLKRFELQIQKNV